MRGLHGDLYYRPHCIRIRTIDSTVLGSVLRMSRVYVGLDYAYHRTGLYVDTWLFTAHVTRTGSYVDLYYAPHGTGLHVNFHDAPHGTAPALMLDGFDGRSRIS